MASTSRFREVSKDDVENVLQSAIQEKTKKASAEKFPKRALV